MSRLSLFFVASLCLLATDVLRAQDRILLQQAGGSRIPLTGYVEEYNGREVMLRIKPNDPVRRYPRSDVIEVTTEYTPHHERGRQFFAAGKIAEAKLELATALNDEDRQWVRREILATQVKCAMWTGDYHSAVSRFLPIAESDVDTFHFGLIPLCWTDEEPIINMRFDAREWISPSASSLSKLIGASWLLAVPDGAADAEQALRRLARDADSRIQRLAQMQLWRLKLKKNAQVDSNEIERWDRFVQELPLELRGGSYFVIGQAWKQSQEYERAARAYLWLPLVFDSDRWLSSRACFEAAECLRKVGDQAQAANLYREAVFRYGDTPSGRKAETAWKELQNATPAAVKSGTE